MAMITEKEYNKTMTQSVTEEHHYDISWWLIPLFLITFIMVSTSMDMMVLHDVMDKAMLQSKLMGMIMALGVGFVINMIPVYLPRLVHQAIYKTRRHAWAMVIISIIGFVILYGSTVILRFAYHDMYGTVAGQLINTVAAGESNRAETNDTFKGYAVVILLCLEPLATSICNFIVSYLSDDPVRKEKETLELQITEEDGRIAILTAKLATMERDIEQALQIDEDQMWAAIPECIAIGDILKAKARLYLAEYLADPQATTRLSHELPVVTIDIPKQYTADIVTEYAESPDISNDIESADDIVPLVDTEEIADNVIELPKYVTSDTANNS